MNTETINIGVSKKADYNVVNLFSNNITNHQTFGDADFDIELKPLFYTTDGVRGLQEVNKKAIVRTDTGDHLGIVGPKYKAVNHKDMIANQRAIIERSDLNIDDIQESIVTDRNGARCYVKHTLPKQFIETPDGDTAALTFLGVNSFDGLFSFMLSAGARQSACMNGQIFTEGSSTIYKARHTQRLDIDAGARIVAKGLEVMMGQNELWKHWYHTVPSSEVIRNIFAAAIGMDGSDMEIWMKPDYLYLCRTFDTIYKERQGNNLWAVYNTLTHWVTHCPSRRKGSSILSVQSRRTAKVSSIISGDMFRKAA